MDIIVHMAEGLYNLITEPKVEKGGEIYGDE